MKMTSHKPLNTFQRLWRTIKRVFMAVIGLACLALFWTGYTTIHPVAASRGGRVALWSAGAALSPVVGSIPWYVYGGAALMAVWLWTRHKIVGTLFAALIFGAWLAL